MQSVCRFVEAFIDFGYRQKTASLWQGTAFWANRLTTATAEFWRTAIKYDVSVLTPEQQLDAGCYNL